MKITEVAVLTSANWRKQKWRESITLMASATCHHHAPAPSVRSYRATDHGYVTPHFDVQQPQIRLLTATIQRVPACQPGSRLTRSPQTILTNEQIV